MVHVDDTGALHHLELWVDDLDRALASWGWLLGALGYTQGETWSTGCSWAHGATYLVLEAGHDVGAGGHDRLRPGLNHVAFHAGTADRVDALVRQATEHGWTLLFADRHPYAGGPDHYAAYLENDDGYEVELVATA